MIGVITGSGADSLPGLVQSEPLEQETPWGRVALSRGTLAGVEVVQLSRHGEGHVRLSHQVTHRANVWALREAGVRAVVGCTACGAVDHSLSLGSLVVFADLHFPSNRLPGGSLCTFFTEPGDPERAHWVLHGPPFSDELRGALNRAARRARLVSCDGGIYGHVDGPRFNTPVEIRELARIGVTAVSQTGGPETVLCGELGLPYALVGFVTDYANEVRPGEPTPVATLAELMGRSRTAFAELLAAALPELGDGAAARPAGTVFRIQSG